jgi:hypothetical protein
MQGRIRRLLLLRGGGVVAALAEALINASVSILVFLCAFHLGRTPSFNNAPGQFLAREASRGVSSSTETAKCCSPREGLLLVRRKDLVRDLCLSLWMDRRLGPVASAPWYPRIQYTDNIRPVAIVALPSIIRGLLMQRNPRQFRMHFR